MDGWEDWLEDRWTDRWMDGLTDCLSACLTKLTSYGWVDGQTGEGMDVPWTDRWTDQPTDQPDFFSRSLTDWRTSPLRPAKELVSVPTQNISVAC